MLNDSTRMSQKTDLDRKLLIEFTKASKEARGKSNKFNCETSKNNFKLERNNFQNSTLAVPSQRLLKSRRASTFTGTTLARTFHSSSEDP